MLSATNSNWLYLVLQVTRKNFKFAAKYNLPFFFVSAADGTNVVKVCCVSPLSPWSPPPVLRLLGHIYVDIRMHTYAAMSVFVLHISLAVPTPVPMSWVWMGFISDCDIRVSHCMVWCV